MDDFYSTQFRCISNRWPKAYPVVSDLTALFGCQAGLVDVFGLAVLAESSDAHGRSHMLICRSVEVRGMLWGMKGEEKAQGELVGEES